MTLSTSADQPPLATTPQGNHTMELDLSVPRTTSYTDQHPHSAAVTSPPVVSSSSSSSSPTGAASSSPMAAVLHPHHHQHRQQHHQQTSPLIPATVEGRTISPPSLASSSSSDVNNNDQPLDVSLTHMETPREAEERSNTTCKICDRKLANISCLRVHMRIHTGEKPFRCNVCGRKFAQLGHLNNHKITHTGEKPHSCPICNKRFTQKSTMQVHMTTHTGNKKFKCDICGKKLISSGALNVHRRVHTGERPYTCPICGEAYIQANGLSSHMSKHEGVQPYQCTKCFKSFKYHRSMTLHMQSCSGGNGKFPIDQSSSSPEEEKFQLYGMNRYTGGDEVSPENGVHNTMDGPLFPSPQPEEVPQRCSGVPDQKLDLNGMLAHRDRLHMSGVNTLVNPMTNPQNFLQRPPARLYTHQPNVVVDSRATQGFSNYQGRCLTAANTNPSNVLIPMESTPPKPMSASSVYPNLARHFPTQTFNASMMSNGDNIHQRGSQFSREQMDFIIKQQMIQNSAQQFPGMARIKAEPDELSQEQAYHNARTMQTNRDAYGNPPGARTGPAAYPNLLDNHFANIQALTLSVGNQSDMPGPIVGENMRRQMSHPAALQRQQVSPQRQLISPQQDRLVSPQTNQTSPHQTQAAFPKIPHVSPHQCHVAPQIPHASPRPLITSPHQQVSPVQSYQPHTPQVALQRQSMPPVFRHQYSSQAQPDVQHNSTNHKYVDNASLEAVVNSVPVTTVQTAPAVLKSEPIDNTSPVLDLSINHKAKATPSSAPVGLSLVQQKPPSNPSPDKHVQPLDLRQTRSVSHSPSTSSPILLATLKRPCQSAPVHSHGAQRSSSLNTSDNNAHFATAHCKQSGYIPDKQYARSADVPLFTSNQQASDVIKSVHGCATTHYRQKLMYKSKPGLSATIPLGVVSGIRQTVSSNLPFKQESTGVVQPSTSNDSTTLTCAPVIDLTLKDEVSDMLSRSVTNEPQPPQNIHPPQPAEPDALDLCTKEDTQAGVHGPLDTQAGVHGPLDTQAGVHGPLDTQAGVHGPLDTQAYSAFSQFTLAKFPSKCDRSHSGGSSESNANPSMAAEQHHGTQKVASQFSLDLADKVKAAIENAFTIAYQNATQRKQSHNSYNAVNNNYLDLSKSKEVNFMRKRRVRKRRSVKMENVENPVPLDLSGNKVEQVSVSSDGTTRTSNNVSCDKKASATDTLQGVPNEKHLSEAKTVQDKPVTVQEGALNIRDKPAATASTAVENTNVGSDSMPGVQAATKSLDSPVVDDAQSVPKTPASIADKNMTRCATPSESFDSDSTIIDEQMPEALSGSSPPKKRRTNMEVTIKLEKCDDSSPVNRRESQEASEQDKSCVSPIEIAPTFSLKIADVYSIESETTDSDLAIKKERDSDVNNDVAEDKDDDASEGPLVIDEAAADAQERNRTSSKTCHAGENQDEEEPPVTDSEEFPYIDPEERRPSQDERDSLTSFYDDDQGNSKPVKITVEEHDNDQLGNQKTFKDLPVKQLRYTCITCSQEFCSIHKFLLHAKLSRSSNSKDGESNKSMATWNEDVDDIKPVWNETEDIVDTKPCTAAAQC